MSMTRYQVIRSHVLSLVEAGQLKSFDRVPSENELAEQFSVSRMTARKALQSLLDSGVITRVRGKGSFVADLQVTGSSMRITNIAEDVRAKGHTFSSNVHSLEKITVSGDVARRLLLLDGETVFYSDIVHFDNELPIQWERRYVLCEQVPEYLSQDFNERTTHDYLAQVAPLAAVRSSISAINADAVAVERLNVVPHEACLLVERLTESRDGIVAFSQLIYPGTRHKLGASYEL